MSRFRFTDELDKARALLAEAKTIIDNLEDTSDSVDMSVLENADEPLQTIIDAIDNILLFEEEREDEDEGAQAEET